MSLPSDIGLADGKMRDDDEIDDDDDDSPHFLLLLFFPILHDTEGDEDEEGKKRERGRGKGSHERERERLCGRTGNRAAFSLETKPLSQKDEEIEGRERE